MEGSPAGTGPDEEFGGQSDAVGGRFGVFDAADQGADGEAADFVARDADGREGRAYDGAKSGAVKPDDSQVARDFEAQVVGGAEDAEGDVVVGGEDGDPGLGG